MNSTNPGKLFRCAATAVMLVASLSSEAIIYKYDEFNSTAGTCRLASWSGNQPSSGKLTIPSSYVDDKGRMYNVTSIASHSLDNLTEVTQITIPGSIVRIGDSAFGKGTAITDADERVYNFFNCPSLEKFVVTPDNKVFQSTEDGLLYSKGLGQLLRVPDHVVVADSTLKLSSGTVAISEDAFRGNTSVARLELPAEARIYGNGGLNRASSIASYSVYGDGARLKVSFEALLCKDIEDGSYEMVSFPRASATDEAGVGGNAAVVRDEAFFGCANLKKIYLHQARSIGARALSQTGITEIFFPREVEQLGEGVLERNNNLISIRSSMDGYMAPVLPKHFASDCPNLIRYDGLGKVYDLSTAAFKNCPNLKEFPFKGNLRLSGDSIFFNTGFERIEFTGATAEEYEPGRAIFGNCRNLREIDASIISHTNDNPFPFSSDYASGCLKLKTLRLPTFARIVRKDKTDNPPFGYSCTLDTIESHTVYGLETTPSFCYSTVNSEREYRPMVMLALTDGQTWEKNVWNEWPAGNAFAAGNGAAVYPQIYIDSYNPPANYVNKNATYYVGAMCKENYSEASDAGCEVHELFKLTLEFPKGGNMMYQVDTIPGLPHQIKTFTIRTNHKRTNLGDFGKKYSVSDDHINITNLTVTYVVNGYSFETDYGDPHDLPVDSSGIDIITPESIDAETEIYTPSGHLLGRKHGCQPDLTDYPAGMYILRIKDNNGVRTEKIKK
ncbi:MAG: leucine-rich repeat domain-containing protein [Muribaculaceae bacterium]|nr:leucine-rich repeat domain-containing protein [Muribaculaceae bacterium]MDE6754042.1 leucine-rich repeat domain-containing protein [Muribaculaceae bacterium]